jgi:hypothetical protein
MVARWEPPGSPACPRLWIARVAQVSGFGTPGGGDRPVAGAGAAGAERPVGGDGDMIDADDLADVVDEVLDDEQLDTLEEAAVDDAALDEEATLDEDDEDDELDDEALDDLDGSDEDLEGGELDDNAVRAELDEARRRLAAVPAADVVANHAMGLFELAAIHLGATPPHLSDAALAIDALGALVDALGERLGDNGKVLRDALAQIRLAFVQVRGAS